MNIEQILEHEAQLMGRPVTYRNAWETVFNDKDGRERSVGIVVYDCDALLVQDITFHEIRAALVIDGDVHTSSIV